SSPPITSANMRPVAGPSEPLMTMPEVHPEPVVLRRLSDQGQHVRRTRPSAEPWLPLERISQLEQLSRGRLGTSKLDGRGRRAPGRQLGTCRDTKPLLHRCQNVPERSIPEREVELAAADKMPVIAAFA